MRVLNISAYSSGPKIIGEFVKEIFHRSQGTLSISQSIEFYFRQKNVRST